MTTRTVPLEEILDLCDSGEWGDDPINEEGVPVLRVADVKADNEISFATAPLRLISSAKLESKTLKNGDIVVVKSSGSATNVVSGRASMVAGVDDNKYGFANFLLRLRVNERRYSAKFLIYILSSQQVRDCVLSMVAGSTYPNLRVPEYRQILIPEPPLSEQRRIVSKLDAAFGALREAEANLERNRANARELFASYLNGVFEGREGWREYTLPDLAENLDSKRVPITKSDRKAGPYPYYGASGIVDHVHDFIFDEECLLVSEDGANLLMRSTPIAFSVSGKYWVNNHAHILRFPDRATQRIVEYYLENLDLSPWITGAAQPKLNQSAMNSIPIWLPTSISERAIIVERLDELKDQSTRLEITYQQQLTGLGELKRSVLGAAFSGQL